MLKEILEQSILTFVDLLLFATEEMSHKEKKNKIK